MRTQTRLIILGIICLWCFASLGWQLQVRHIVPDVSDQSHDGIREAEVIAFLGTPWPTKHDADGGPIPVALVAGPWTSCG
jgi:hypothetical protein